MPRPPQSQTLPRSRPSQCPAVTTIPARPTRPIMPESHERPSPAFDAPGKAHQQQRSRKLTEIERGERRTDEIGPAGLGEIAGQKSVGGKIKRADAAENQTETPESRAGQSGHQRDESAPLRALMTRRHQQYQQARWRRSAPPKKRKSRASCRRARETATGTRRQAGSRRPEAVGINTGASTIRSGSQRPTSAGMAGWVTATPAPMTTVAANRKITLDAPPRPADPDAVSSNPDDGRRHDADPRHQARADKGRKANTTIGTPVRIPIAVPER